MVKEYQSSEANKRDKQVEIETLYKLAEARANQKTKIINIIMKGIGVIRIAVGLALFVVVIYIFIERSIAKIMNMKIMKYPLEGWLSVLTPVFGLFIFLLIDPIKELLEKRFSYNEIKQREFKRLEKEYETNQNNGV